MIGKTSLAAGVMLCILTTAPHAHAQSSTLPASDSAAPAATVVDSTAAAPAARAPAPVGGPTREAAGSAVRPLATQPADVAGAEAGLQRASRRNAQALMVVGAAGLIVGLVVGGDAGTLFALGGAAVGLYGLYLWLQ